MTRKQPCSVMCPRCGGSGMVPNPVTAGLQLRRVRFAAGLTLREVGALFGVSHAYISDLEHGRRQFKPYYIKDLRWYARELKRETRAVMMEDKR